MENIFSDLANFVADTASVNSYARPGEDTDRPSDNADYAAETREVEQRIAEIIPPPAVPPTPRTITVPVFDHARNLLEREPMQKFVDNIFTPTANFTPVLSTTNTMEGLVSNVSFHERDLIKRVRPNTDIIMYHCNYGWRRYPGYIPPIRVRKKLVVRRRRPRRIQGNGTDFNSQLTAVIRSRTSVIGGKNIFPYDIFRLPLFSFFVEPPAIPPELEDIAAKILEPVTAAAAATTSMAPTAQPTTIADDSEIIGAIDEAVRLMQIVEANELAEFEDQLSSYDQPLIYIPTSTPVYKFKIFRTGTIQLPGVRPDIIDDVMACTNILVRSLNEVLHPNVTDPTKLTHLIYMMPVMKNYKFRTIPRVDTEYVWKGNKMVPVQREYPLIDLGHLKALLKKYHSFVTPTINEYGVEIPPPEPDWGDQAPPAAPAIFDIKYTREDTKLSIKFATPIHSKAKKRTRVNIFMSGKINILGAFDDAATDAIVQYLDWIFRLNQDLFVESYAEVPWELDREDNILPLTGDEESQILFSLQHGLPAALPALSANDAADALAWLGLTATNE